MTKAGVERMLAEVAAHAAAGDDEAAHAAEDRMRERVLRRLRPDERGCPVVLA